MSDQTGMPRRIQWMLTGLFVILRLPLLIAGYGTDPDSWRIANAAAWLRTYGEYRYSRPPGYPIPELINALVPHGQWLLSNALTLLLSTAAFLGFLRLIRGVDRRTAVPAAQVFIGAPVLVVNSATTMDYCWALAGILWCHVLLENRRPVWAGLLLGAACGCRMTSMLYLLPMFLLLWRPESRRMLRPFMLSALGAAALCLSPVLFVYGVDFLQYVPTGNSVIEASGLLAQNLLGLPGTIWLCGMAVLWILDASARREFRNEPDNPVIILGIAAGVLPFLLLPEDPAYCIPGLVYGLILIARNSRSPRLVWGLAVLCLLTSLGGELRIRRGGRVEPRPGVVLYTLEQKRLQVATAETVLGADVPASSCIITGLLCPVLSSLQPALLTREPDAPAQWNDRTYVYLLERQELVESIQRYKGVYILPAAREFTVRRYGYDPMEYGARVLGREQGRGK